MNKGKIKIMLEKLLKEKPSALFAVGLAGILLIGLGSIANGNAGGGGDSRKTADTQIRSAEEYANELEQRLEGLLSQIDGVGKARDAGKRIRLCVRQSRQGGQRPSGRLQGGGY